MLGDPCRLTQRFLSPLLARHVAKAYVTCRLTLLALSPGYVILGDDPREQCHPIPRSQATGHAMYVASVREEGCLAQRSLSPLLAMPVALSGDPCRLPPTHGT
jgi:hypothetical protein